MQKYELGGGGGGGVGGEEVGGEYYRELENIMERRRKKTKPLSIRCLSVVQSGFFLLLLQAGERF